MEHTEVFCHIRERVFERFGVDLRLDDFRKVAESIRNGSAEYIGKAAGGRETYLTEVEDAKIVWIYDPSCGLPITALTRGMWRNSEKRRLEGVVLVERIKKQKAARAEAERRMAELVTG